MRTGGTLVFLMGVTSLSAICAGLVAPVWTGTPRPLWSGAPRPCSGAWTPPPPPWRRAAAGAGGRARHQRLRQRVRPGGSGFDWFDRLPLKGRRVVVTGPGSGRGPWPAGCGTWGADVVEYPLHRDRAHRALSGHGRALERIGAYEWLALTSPAGVSALMDELDRQGKDARALGGA